MKFESFDEDYVRRLAEGDPLVGSHFASYFGELLQLKLRRRLPTRQDVEDACQSTLLRVLEKLRRDGGVDHPEGFGAFVNAVCNNVLKEKLRNGAKHPGIAGPIPDPPSDGFDAEARLVTEERKQIVREVLDQLSQQDRSLLRAVFLEEQDKDEVCLDLGVDRSYLRVLLHRAKSHFRKKMLK